MEKLNKIFKTIEIAEIDRYTIEHEPITSLELMERAARIWTDFFQKKIPNCFRVAVLAGWGNNGGDGFVIARLLKERMVDVTVYVLAHTKMSPDCEVNYKRYKEVGGSVQVIEKVDDFILSEETWIIDALFGAGLNRKVSGLAANLIRQINRVDNKVVAVDMPSGLMGEDNSCNDPEAIVQADYTFTFQFPKLAFMLPENNCYVGEWSVLDIGLHVEGIEAKPTPYYYVLFEEIARLLPRPYKFAHKGMNGTGLLVAGGYGMMGAAILAAKAAVRSGIGLLCCHVPAATRELVHATVPEAIIDLDESNCRSFERCAMDKYDAVAIGPAIGKGPEMVEGMRRLLTGWRGTTIIDADALNILAEHRDFFDLLHERCILTPHMKEFERLTGKSENDFERLNKLSNFANHCGVHVVLKGAHTVVAAPNGELYFNMSGNPGMAKGGAGDVLTGVLLGLAANGLNPLDVALIGVFAHGLSGDIAAKEWGMRGLCAGMIADGMGRAWRMLEECNNNLTQ